MVRDNLSGTCTWIHTKVTEYCTCYTMLMQSSKSIHLNVAFMSYKTINFSELL